MPNLIGKSGVLVHTVMPTDLATHWKNQLPVLATPILLWLAELATIKAVEGALAPDSMTVGIGHHNRHLARGWKLSERRPRSGPLQAIRRFLESSSGMPFQKD